jgi:hypothetical protein
MLAKECRKKIHVIPESQWYAFLEAGFETYLPNDVAALGKADTDKLVKDFVAYRKKVEE